MSRCPSRAAHSIPASCVPLLLGALALFLLAPHRAAAAEGPAAGDYPGLALFDSLWLGNGKVRAYEETPALIEGARAERDDYLLTELLLRRGSASVFFSRPHEAENALREGLALAEERGDAAQVCRALRWLAHALSQQRRDGEAAEMTDRLLRLARETGDRSNEGWALVGQASRLNLAAREEEAIVLLEEAVRCFRDAGDGDGFAWANFGIGLCQDDLGNYEEAIAIYRETAESTRDKRALMVVPMALNNIARLEYLRGRFEVAMTQFEEARRSHLSVGNRLDAVVAAINVARCLHLLGRDSESIDTLDAARAVCVERGFHDMERTVLLTAADLLSEMKRDGETLRICRELEEQEEDLSSHQRVTYRIMRARALAHRDGPAEGVRAAEEVLEFVEAKGTIAASIQLHSRLGIWLAELGEYRKALAHDRLVVDAAESGALRGYLVTALNESARCYRALGRPDSALVLVERAARLWEEERSIPADPRWRERRGTAGRAVFGDLAASYLDDPHRADPLRDAFDRLQLYKARTLLERMTGPGSALAALEERRSCPTVDLAAVQRDVLRDGELLLDFYIGYHGSLLFAVTRDEARVVRLPGEVELWPRVERYYDLLSAETPKPAGILEEAGGGLSDLLLGDIGEMLAGCDRVLVSADGGLNLLPFVEFPGIFRESREWSRVPSASILAMLRRRGDEDDPAAARRPARVLAVASGGEGPGARLAGAVAEVRALDRKFEHVEAVRAGERAAPPAEWTSYDVLHIATHVRADDPSPWQSEILFRPYGDRANPRASAIAALRLPAKLVVLSSCHTASGPIVSGEGLVGLANAFISAGAPAVLATLWAVDDGATARLVGAFYDALAGGECASAALLRAQGALRADPATAHPFYWAGFVLTGDGGVTVRLEPRRNVHPALAAAIFVAVATAILLVTTRRRR